jgi:tripartite ATP-independent transporter DctP family solute receptor
MLTRRSFLRRAGALGLALTARPRPARAADPRTFTFGYDQPRDTAYGFFADTFSKRLAETSKGTLAIRQFPSAALGQEPEMAQKIRAGDIDFALNATANTSTVVPQAGVFSLHYIFRDQEHLARSMNDRGINETFKKMIVENTTGARSLGLMTLGFRNMYSKLTVSNVGDVAGKKVRVQATKTEDAFFTAYKAVPIHMPFGQVYTSLQTGLVDIAENGFDIVLKNKHYEAAPVVSKTEHEANCNQLWMSQKTWDSLTEEQRGWVVEAAEYTRPLTIRRALELDAAAAQSLQKLGVMVHSKVDKQGFMALARPLQDPQAKELGPYAVELLGQIRAVQ